MQKTASDDLKAADYLKANYDYWKKGYEAENVESQVFRVYGRIFKAQFGMDGSKGEKLLDFGCGAGAALEFFYKKGFDVYGVDISPIDIERCKARIPDRADHFAVIGPSPRADDVFFGGDYDVVISIQTLMYFTDTALKARLESLYKQMKSGAIIYATMIGTQASWHSKNAVYQGDGLWKADFKSDRIEVKDYFENFTDDEQDLLDKFSMFRKIHIGYYAFKYREDEGNEFFYTYVGMKD